MLDPSLLMQLSLFKPERRGLGQGPASPAASVASASSQPSSPQAEDRPKRSLSRSGSTRMLSLENLQKAGQSPPDAQPHPIQVCTKCCYVCVQSSCRRACPSSLCQEAEACLA